MKKELLSPKMILIFTLISLFLLKISFAEELWEAKPLPQIELEYLANRPWLLDRSLWFQEVDHLKGDLPLDRLSPFAVGNGLIFGLFGLNYPFTTLHNAIGPDYQKDDFETVEDPGGFFGDIPLAFEQNGKTRQFRKEYCFKVRRTTIVLIHQSDPDLSLTTINFAPPQIPAIISIIILKNLANAPLLGGSLSLQPFDQIEVKSPQVLRHLRPPKRLAMAFFDQNYQLSGTVSHNRLTLDTQILYPKKEEIFYLLYVSSYDDPSENAAFDQILNLGIDNLLDQTFQHWQDWFNRGAIVLTPDPKVNDLIEDQAVMVKNQMASTGAIAPMSRYSLTWIRDTIGPVLFFLRLGRFEDVKAMLDYAYYGYASRCSISNAMPVNLDLSHPSIPDDWEDCSVMASRNKAEAPSYIPIMYDHYARWTGDKNLLQERFYFLKRCITGQHISPDGLLQFSGDETFQYNIRFAIGDLRPLKDYYFSANSSFLFSPAAEIVARTAREMGLNQESERMASLANWVRESAERYYWLQDYGFYSTVVKMDDLSPIPVPYEDVSLIPLWCGYGKPEFERCRSNFLKLLEANARPDGFIQYHANLEIFTGMTPGYSLYNLALMDHPFAEASFNTYARFHDQSGNVHEDHFYPDGKRILFLYDPSGYIGDTIATYRPWEGGINMDALLFYLTGLIPSYQTDSISLAPHLPNGWQSLHCQNIRFRDKLFHLAVKGGDNWISCLINCPQGSLKIEQLTLSFEADLCRGVAIDGEILPPYRYQTARDFGRAKAIIPDLLIAEDGKPKEITAYFSNYPATPTPWPTPLPSLAPKILLAGYMRTALSRTEPSAFHLVAFAPDFPSPIKEVQLYYQGMSTGICLFDDGLHSDFQAEDGIYGLSLALTPEELSPLPSNLLLSLKARDLIGRLSFSWPFLEVR